MSSKPLLPWPDRFSERLHIFALGEAFDVDAFLAASTLKPDHVWRRREGGIKTSGLEMFLGDGRTIRLRKQEDIAITYLKEHRDELRSLAQCAGLEAINL